MMSWIIENWYIVVSACAACVVAGFVTYQFVNLPVSEKWKRVSSWMLSAVVEAEKVLGAQTGQLKLAMVYDMFISKFPIVSSIMPFSTFSKLVDVALEKMRALLTTNAAIKTYIEND